MKLRDCANLFSEKPYNGQNHRKTIAAQILCAIFCNFDEKKSQRRYFRAILRKKIFCIKRPRARAYTLNIRGFLALFGIFFAQKLVHSSLGAHLSSKCGTTSLARETAENVFRSNISLSTPRSIFSQRARWLRPTFRRTMSIWGEIHKTYSVILIFTLM